MSTKEIKNIICSILKDVLEKGEFSGASNYGISSEKYYQIIHLMVNESYLNNEKISFTMGGGVNMIKGLDAITMRGINFLEENDWN